MEFDVTSVPMIECRSLTKTFGALTAVNALNLVVKKGELFGFLGPNGAGKTTSIKMMTGLLKPTAGTAIMGGYDIQVDPLKAKAIFGYIPDNPFLYDKLTAFEFINFMADLYSVPKPGRYEKIWGLLELFELSDKGNELIQGFSRGMRQKTALAGALIHQPKIIILDEPTVGLDPKSARLMKDILRKLCDDGTTVLISTHILEIAERMCDRFAILNKGNIVASGTMSELREERAGDSASLEDIFLELTGGDEHKDLIKYLG